MNLELVRVKKVPCWSTLILDTSASLHLDSDLYWVAKTHADDLINSFTDTGTEQSRPALLRQSAKNLLQILLESKVQKSVGLV